jgi:hypothetical protein
MELRIFRGTLNRVTFWATLELVDNLCRIAASMSIEALKSIAWRDIINYCAYPELAEYNDKMVGDGWQGGSVKARKILADASEAMEDAIDIPGSVPKSVKRIDRYCHIKDDRDYEKYRKIVEGIILKNNITDLGGLLFSAYAGSDSGVLCFMEKCGKVTIKSREPLVLSAFDYWINKTKLNEMASPEIAELWENFGTLAGYYIP